MFTEFKSLPELMIKFRRPETAVKYFEAIRWRNGIFCPYCDCRKIYAINKRGKVLRKCAECKLSFSVTVGTVFENTKLPLRIWFGAIWLLVNHPKGIASTTLAKDLHITQSSAWFVLHRLRYAARTKSFDKPLGGIVEIDQAFVKGLASKARKDGNVGILGAAERKGRVVARVVPLGVGTIEAQKFFDDAVSPKAELVITDAHRVFHGVEGFPQHRTINHAKEGKRRGRIHTQTIEGVWSQLKRQIVGVHHWVSPKHLQQYVSEMAWRMSNRDLSLAGRVDALCGDTEGRLTYKALIA
jgi:hypothetical protein